MDGAGGRQGERQKTSSASAGQILSRVLQVKRPEIDLNQEERVTAEGRITGEGRGEYEEGAKDKGKVAVIT